MLASHCFVKSILKNRGESRTYHRATYLAERVMSAAALGRFCSTCHSEIQTGETYAVDSYSRYCSACYGEMPAALAEATITTDGIGCVRVARREHRGVEVHDLHDCAIVFGDAGQEYRFRDLAEATACIDAALAMTAAGGAREFDLPILSSLFPVVA